jgi:hypothetical protein
MRLPLTWVANDPENKVVEGDIRAAATLPTLGSCLADETICYKVGDSAKA